MLPLSGEQHRIRAGRYEATVASVGASLRSLTVDGRDLIVPFDADEVRPAMRGAILAPWPNRLADGRYRFGGVEHQLVVDESATRTASHGLVPWLDFDLVDRSASCVQLRGTIVPQPGYPWRIRVDVLVEVGGFGLAQRIEARNESATAAPVGLGGHPYLIAGHAVRGAADAWSLRVPADDVLLISADRALPIGVVAVDHGDGRFDFRRSRPLAGTVLNNAFGSLIRDADGLARAMLSGPDGSVTLSVDSSCTWLQVYTSDEGPSSTFRSAVAIEPMTCPPDAFNSGTHLRVLEPGATTSLAWSIRG